MSIYLFRINWDQFTLESRDRCVWGFHADSSTPPTLTGFEGAVNGALDSAGAITPRSALPNNLEVVDFQLYDVVAGGAPIDEAVPTAAITGTGVGPGPSELQVAVSKWVLDGLGRPFKKGRFYFGPLHGSQTTPSRPSINLREAACRFAQHIYDHFVVSGWDPVVDTKGALHVPATITQLTADDAWDVQRRRGIDPTDDGTIFPVPSA